MVLKSFVSRQRGTNQCACPLNVTAIRQIQLGDVGDCKLVQWVWAKPQPKTEFLSFSYKIWHLLITISNGGRAKKTPYSTCGHANDASVFMARFLYE